MKALAYDKIIKITVFIDFVCSLKPQALEH